MMIMKEEYKKPEMVVVLFKQTVTLDDSVEDTKFMYDNLFQDDF